MKLHSVLFHPCFGLEIHWESTWKTSKLTLPSRVGPTVLCLGRLVNQCILYGNGLGIACVTGRYVRAIARVEPKKVQLAFGPIFPKKWNCKSKGKVKKCNLTEKVKLEFIKKLNYPSRWKRWMLSYGGPSRMIQDKPPISKGIEPIF